MPRYLVHMEGGGTMSIRGDLGPHCGDSRCADVGVSLCDFPVGEGKTCDMPLCPGHSFEVAPDMHYCPAHTTMWREFKESGGVERELKNVVPYSRNSEGSGKDE